MAILTLRRIWIAPDTVESRRMAEKRDSRKKKEICKSASFRLKWRHIDSLSLYASSSQKHLRPFMGPLDAQPPPIGHAQLGRALNFCGESMLRCLKLSQKYLSSLLCLEICFFFRVVPHPPSFASRDVEGLLSCHVMCQVMLKKVSRDPPFKMCPGGLLLHPKVPSFRVRKISKRSPPHLLSLCPQISKWLPLNREEIFFPRDSYEKKSGRVSKTSKEKNILG